MPKTKNRKFHKGFTILEISIVLIIVGLLIAGVLGGQEVIKAMKINAVIAKLKEVETSSNTFKSKYDSFPGDMPDATDYWPDCYYVSELTECNGNGDDRIGNYNQETMYFWRHLSLSEIAKENYNLESENLIPLFNIPNSDPYAGFFSIIDSDSDGFYNGMIGNNIMYLSLIGSIQGGPTDCDSISSIDFKIDDGRYNNGIVRVNHEEGDGCRNTNSPNGLYNYNTRGVGNLLIKYDF